MTVKLAVFLLELCVCVCFFSGKEASLFPGVPVRLGVSDLPSFPPILLLLFR